MASELPANIDALIVRCQKGDTQAFGLIYDALVKPVYRYLFYRTDVETAEDLTEETFLRVWQHLPRYRAGKTPFSAWVFRIAHNLLTDHYRKHKPTDEIADDVADHNDAAHPIKLTELRLNQVRLKQAIGKLGDRYQQVIVLKYINELSNIEVAATLGKTEAAVRVLQFRALKELKKMLGAGDDF